MIANTTYVSENALLPSFSELQFSEEYSIKAQRYTTEYLEHLREYQVQNHSIIEGNGIAEDLPPLSQWIADWVEVKLRSIRLSNVYQHKFITKDGVRCFSSFLYYFYSFLFQSLQCFFFLTVLLLNYYLRLLFIYLLYYHQIIFTKEP